MAFTSENIIRVYDDDIGEYVYVGPDADCIEARSCDKDHHIFGNGQARVTMQKCQALLVAQAIMKLLKQNN